MSAPKKYTNKAVLNTLNHYVNELPYYISVCNNNYIMRNILYIVEEPAMEYLIKLINSNTKK